MKLSVLVPGIRTKNWCDLYNSIVTSIGEYDWEIIFVGPYDLPENLKDKLNIQYIQDWGSPIRCQQIALERAQGEYVSWAADDGIFLPSALNEAILLLKDKDYKTLVMGKYQEGEKLNNTMESNWYYVLTNHHDCQLPFIPIGTLMLNCGVVSRKLLLEVGGWNAYTFEVCPCAYNDLAIRLQKYEVEFIIQTTMMFSCTHMPGHMGDHGPIHDAQVYFDQPKFNKIYSTLELANRIAIPLNNWKSSPEKWERRFK